MLLVIHLIMFNSCSLFNDTLKVEVPKGFIGWGYVIPVNDISVKTSPVVDGKYQVDSNGVVLIPASAFDVRKDHVLKVYEMGVDISDDTRYTGSVHRANSTDSVKYNYIHFYLPALNERNIPDAAEYWRDKSYEYGSIGYKRFDSLLRARKIVF